MAETKKPLHPVPAEPAAPRVTTPGVAAPEVATPEVAALEPAAPGLAAPRVAGSAAAARRREPLWRHMVGDQLRQGRHARGETLGETADHAGVSPQYLSEMERGVKEPSSEMIAAVAAALDLTLLDLTHAVTDELQAVRDSRALPRATGPAGQVSLALAA